MNLFPRGIQGLADSRWQGVPGSVFNIVGVDYRSTPGLIQVHQKLTKNSPSTGDNVVDELCKVNLPLSDGSTLWFSSESGKIWREVDDAWTLISTLKIPGYALSLRTAVDANKSYAYNAQINIPTGHFFKPDGLKMYVIGNADVSGNSGEIFQYTLSTAFDVSTASYASKTFTADQNATGMYISNDGLKLYICEDNGTFSVIEYDLGTAWDISTAVASGDTFVFSAQTNRGYGITFKSDGTEMYIVGGDDSSIHQYTLSTGFDLTTASFTGSIDVSTDVTSLYQGIGLSSDGKHLLLMDTTSSGRIHEFVLGTAYDITSAVHESAFDIDNNRTFGLALFPDDSGFVAGVQSNNETVYQYTLTGAAEDLNVTILGAEEFVSPALDAAEDDDPVSHIYFATENWLFRIPLADVATDWNGEYQYISLFTYGDDTYHPFQKQNGRLYIGDKYVIAEINEAGVLTLETPFNVAKTERITAIVDFDVDILVATKEINLSWVKRWDTESDSWYAEDWIPETEITAFLKDDNYVYVLAADFGRMYFYDGESLHHEKRIPGEYSLTSKIKVNPNAVGFFMNAPLFGVSSSVGNPTMQGVYSYGRYSKDYNITLSLDFPLSCDVFEDLEIGSILVSGATLMVSWKVNGYTGVDKIDWTAKYESAFIETGTLVGPKDRSKFKAITEILADYYEMPDDTGVEFSISKNYKGFRDLEESQKVNAKLNQIRCDSSVKELGSVQTLIEFNVNGNETPKVEHFHVNFDGEK